VEQPAGYGVLNRIDLCAEERVSKTTAGQQVTTNKPDNVLVRYFKETRAEIRKVTWPTRQEATNLTAIVLGVTVAMAFFLGAVDYLFATLIRLILG
jgi:preprotein translocase subunit SecE